MLFLLHSAESSYVDIIKLCSCIANQGILLGEWKPVAKDNVCIVPHSSEVEGKWISILPDDVQGQHTINNTYCDKVTSG